MNNLSIKDVLKNSCSVLIDNFGDIVKATAAIALPFMAMTFLPQIAAESRVFALAFFPIALALICYTVIALLGFTKQAIDLYNHGAMNWRTLFKTGYARLFSITIVAFIMIVMCSGAMALLGLTAGSLWMLGKFFPLLYLPSIIGAWLVLCIGFILYCYMVGRMFYAGIHAIDVAHYSIRQLLQQPFGVSWALTKGHLTKMSLYILVFCFLLSSVNTLLQIAVSYVFFCYWPSLPPEFLTSVTLGFQVIASLINIIFMVGMYDELKKIHLRG